MNASVTARELARATLTASIKDEARRQLAIEGAARLSVRAVARELGMASSAVYRYFPTRDDLLTGLIIDGYDTLGAAVELAVASAAPAVDEGNGGNESGPAHSAGPGARDRWRAACRAARTWSIERPHEFGLLFGAPVPDYKAPQDTVGPASRVPLALLSVLNQGWNAGELSSPPDRRSPVAREGMPDLDGQLVATIADLSLDLPPSTLFRATIAWTQLFGMLSFELFGQFVSTFEPADALFVSAVEAMADFIGIQEA